MFGGENVHSITLNVQEDAGGAKTYHLLKMPRAGRVEAAYMVSEQALGAGTAITLSLQNWGTAGTAVEGTVAAAIGTGMAALTPTEATLTAAQVTIGEGEWLVVASAEVGGGFQAGDALQYTVHYVLAQ